MVVTAMSGSSVASQMARVAAPGAYFEGVLDAEHAALQGEEFAVGRRASRYRAGRVRRRGGGCVVGAGGRVQVGHGVGVDGGPAGVGFQVTAVLGALF